MRLWPVFLSVVATHVTAFVPLRPEGSLSHLPIGRRVNQYGAKSLLDDPLLLAPSSEPGKDDEVVVSKSPAFGLQRTLYTHKRNISAKKPRYNTGDHVYMASGPYRNARGTVLSTFRKAPGEPYLVSVVLDCRNECGVLRGALTDYHGTRVTVHESQLTPRPLFSPYSPPPLSCEDSYMAAVKGKGKGSRMSPEGFNLQCITRIINSSSAKELRSVYDLLCRTTNICPLPYQCMLIQLARSLNQSYDIDGVRTLANELLGRLRVSLEEGFSDQSRKSIPWMVWSLHTLHKAHLIRDYESYTAIYRLVRRLLLSNKLPDLTQGEIGLISTGFSSAPFQYKDAYHRLAMIYSYFKPSVVDSKYAATLSGSLSREGISHPGFTRLMCEVVKGQYEVLSSTSALFILEYLANEPDVPQEIKDELLACCSVVEFLKPDASGKQRFREAVRLARLSTSEMEELCIGLRSLDLHLMPYDIMWTLSIMRVSPSTSEVVRLLIILASRYFEEYEPKEQIRLLYASRRLKECPTQLIDALEDHLNSMEEDRVLDPLTLKCMARWLSSIPDSRHSCQRLVLEHVERFINFSLNLSRDSAMDERTLRRMMRNVTDCLQAIPILGYELESLAHSASKLLRTYLQYVPDRLRVLLSMLSILAMSRTLFADASKAAYKLLSDPTYEIDEEVKPLAELLLVVKGAMEGTHCIAPIIERFALPSLPEPVDSDMKVTSTPHMDVKEYPVMFSLLVQSGLLDDRSGALSKLYVFAEDNLSSLSNADLVLMRDALVAIGAFDEKWIALIDSLPKGIDAVTSN